MGPSRIKKYLQLFGWATPTNIDLPGESNGFIPDPAWKKQQFAGTADQTWGDGDTYNMSIGQGFIGITPLQVAAGYAAIANGGTLYQPQMVQKIVDNQRKTVQDKPPIVVRKDFIDPQNLLVVQEGMRHCVNGSNAPLASALILNSLGIPMAAKTGTAQLRKGPDGKDLMNSWVTVYAPYDHPQIVLTIMMENVHEGTMAVLPIAKEVLAWYFGGRPSGNSSGRKPMFFDQQLGGLRAHQYRAASLQAQEQPVVPAAGRRQLRHNLLLVSANRQSILIDLRAPRAHFQLPHGCFNLLPHLLHHGRIVRQTLPPKSRKLHTPYRRAQRPHVRLSVNNGDVH